MQAYYTYLVTHFRAMSYDTPEGLTAFLMELVRRGKELLVNDVRVTGADFLTMSGIFDVVRLVDPRTCQVLHIQPDGSIAPDNQKCYEVWNRCERCKNCTSVKALHDRDWLTKLEVRDGRIYSVLSRYARFGDMDCVLEVALCMEDTPQRRSEEVGFLPDRSDHADKHIEAQKNCSAA